MEEKTRRAEKTKVTRGQVVLAVIILLFTILCFLPVALVLVVSFSSDVSIAERGFTFFPSSWSTGAYKYVFSFGGQLIQSYKITIFETVVGTLLTLLLTSMFAYALSRKDFMLRGPLAVYLLITMLFSGGMLGGYLINANVYHLRNNLLVLVVPGCVSTMNCIVMRTFITSNVPDSLIEAAKIDGAGEVYTFFKIVMPIMAPVLASIGFMCAVGHWNEWQTSMLYIDDSNKATLQLMLMRVEKNIEFLKMRESMGNLSEVELKELDRVPSMATRMALLFCTLGPILVIYPFFKKFFIRGMTIGSVKG